MRAKILLLVAVVCGLVSGALAQVKSTPWTTTTNPAAARGGLGVGFDAVALRTNAEWAIFGLTFKGGETWPPTVNDQQARAVFSADGSQFSGGTGKPVLYGIAGSVRDTALWDFGSSYALSYTTNINANNSTHVPILLSSNLTHWFWKTNINFAMPGETLTLASNFCWSPVWFQEGSNAVLLASISTNSGAVVKNFECRFRIAPTNDLVNGWSQTYRIDNQTGRTNMLDLTPFYDEESGITYAMWKNETSEYIEIGRFDAGIQSALRPVLTNDHSGWYQQVEGNWMVRLPNGKYRIFFVRGYKGKRFGNLGDGNCLYYSESSSVTNGWGAPTNVSIGFYAQSFKPIIVRRSQTMVHAQAATLAGMTLKGRVNIEPEFITDTGLSGYGYSFVNPWPADFPAGINTNDYCGINFGHGDWGQGVYGKGDGSVRLYARTFNSSDSTPLIKTYARDVFIGLSNRVDIPVPLYADSYTARSNGWNLATVTNGMATGDVRYVSSNGWPVQVWLSNGVVQIKPQW